MKKSIRAITSLMSLPILALCLAGLALSTARAGDAASATGAVGPEAPTTTGGGGLQEVVVTATRREEELSKVPISVTALTQDAIDSRGIKDFRDMVRFTPGVTIDDSGTNAISIRGISSSGGAGTTGIYIDDTPIQMRSVGFNPDDTLPKTFDLQRVEVLRGPQGTLFGAGAEGGAVRYIMTPASTTASDSYVRSELSYTEHGQPNGEIGLAVGRPLADGLFGIRASVWYRYDGAWINRVDPDTGVIVDHNINYSHSYMARLAATWQPSPSVTISPSFLYQKQDRHDEPTYWPAYSNPDQGQFNTATPERIGGPDTYYLPAIKLQWDLGKTQLIGNVSYYNRKQLTAYQGTVYDLSYWNTTPGGLGGTNPDGSLQPPLPPKCTTPDDATSCSWFPLIDATGIHLPAALRGTQTPNTMTNTQKSYTAELRLQSADSSSRWTWTAGVFWQQAKEGSIEELKSTNIDQVFNYLYGLAPLDFYGVAAYSCPTNAAYTAIPACDIYYNNNTTIDRQIAGYGEVTYAFTDWMKLTVGERIAHTTFSLEHYADGYENYGAQTTSASQSETPNTPKAVLSFQVDPRNLFYVSYAKGFRVGGGNAPLPPYCDQDLANAGYPNGAPLTYKSDYTQNYEIGAKNGVGDWLRVATSAYYIEWHNIQQNLYVAGNCGLQFTDNLGTAVVKGFDLQAQMLFGPLSIDLATAYTDARFSKDSPANCVPGSYDPSTGVPCKAVNGDAITGQEGINYAPGTTPPWTVAVGVQYNFHLAARETFVRADWQYESRSPWLAAVQDPNAGAVYNSGFSYTYPSNKYTSLRAGMNFGDVQLAAFCDNLFDSHTTTNYILGQTDATYTPQQNTYTFRPRTYGLQLIWHAGAGH